MRRLIGLLAALALSAPAAAAQEGHTPMAPGMGSSHGMRDSAAAMLTMLTERLGLSDDQRVAAMPHVNAMHENALEAHDLMARWRADSTSMDGPAVHQQIEEAHKRMQAERQAFVELLTDEQRAAFEAMHQEMEHGTPGEHHDQDGPHH
jgi:Spy/CpxP family protein refolding chaperone